MTNGGLSNSLDSGLLGVEIGRNRVRLVLLDRRATQIGDAVERPIAKAGGPRDPIEQEFSTRSAIEAGIDRLEIDDLSGLLVGATIGFPNCGVGSGPALQQWLESLSQELDEPVLYTGSSGISYAPVSCVDFVQRVFEPTGLRLGRVELAPVAAARVLTSVRSGAITLGSGVAWSARLLNNQVLEAFETADGGFDDELQVMINGVGQSVIQLDGFEIDQSFGPARGMSPAALAPAVGVAYAMLDSEGPNLLAASHAAGPRVEAVAAAPYASSEAAIEAAGDTLAEPQPDIWDEVAPDPEPDDEVLAAPPPVDAHLEPPQAMHNNDPFGQHHEHQIDDLGMIQDELRASRGVDDTHRLRRAPRSIERSRELREAHAMSTERAGPGADPRMNNGFDRVEAFGQPVASGAPAPGNGFQISDFILGALLMLAIVLAAALVIL